LISHGDSPQKQLMMILIKYFDGSATADEVLAAINELAE